MALQSFPGGASFGLLPTTPTTAPSFTTTALVLDAADEGVLFAVQVPKTGTISKIGWGTRTVTTGATMDVRLETFTGADPSGTLWGTNTNGSQVVADANDNTWFLTSLTAGASVTQGQSIAVVIKNPNTSFGTLQIAGFADDINFEFPYVKLNTGVSPATSWAVANAAPVLAFEYDDGSYVPIDGCYPLKATITATTLSTSTTPDVIGLRLQNPYPTRIRGAVVWLDLDGDFALRLVSTAYHQANATGILATASIDHLIEGATTQGIHVVIFPTPYEMAKDTNYRLIIEPTTGTGLITYDFDVNTLDLLDAVPGGRNWHLTTAKDPTQDADWTNYNSGTFRRLFIWPIFDKFDDAAQTGGAMGVNQTLHTIGSGIQA